MSGLRERIAEALVINVTPGAGWAERLADVLLSLPGVAVVELPEPNNGPGWHIGDVGSVEVNPAFCGGNLRLTDVGFDLVTTTAEGRQFAAVLLAAANAAESVTP